jgi:WD40 repeat protein
VRWAPDATRVLTTGEDSLAILHELDLLDEAGMPRRQYLLHDKPVDEGLFLGDGECVATRMSTLHVSVWHRRGLHLGDLLAGDSGAFAFSATGDGERLLTGTMDKHLAIWDTRSRLVEEHVCRAELRDAFFAADEEHVWVLTSEDELELVDCAGRTVRRSIDLRGAMAQGDHGSSAARAADGAIVVGTDRGRCLVVDAESHVEVPAVRELMPRSAFGPARITSIRSAGSKMALFRAGSGEVALWDPAIAEAGTLVRSIPSEVISIAVQPEEGLTAWGTSGAVLLQAPDDFGSDRGSAGLGSAVMGLAWSDSSRLLAATAPGEIVCFDDELRTVWRRMTGVQIFRLAVAPATELIAVGCGDRRTRLFDLSGEPIVELPEHLGGVRNLEFSRDGRRLLIATTAGQLVVWPIDAVLGSGDLRSSAGPYRRAIDEARSRRGKRD